jgi:phage tail-like protein
MPVTTRALVTDPLRSFKFNVSIQNLAGGQALGSEARLGFTSVSGLGVSIEPLTYREGGDNLTTRKMPGQADFSPIQLSRGLFAGDFDNWNWMTNLFTAMYGGAIPNQQATAAGTPTDFRVGVYINVLEHPNNSAQASGGIYNVTYPYQDSIVKVSFKLYSAWIGSLAYSDFDAGGNSVSVEQMSLNYEGFDVRWGGSGYVTNPRGW